MLIETTSIEKVSPINIVLNGEGGWFLTVSIYQRKGYNHAYEKFIKDEITTNDNLKGENWEIIPFKL